MGIVVFWIETYETDSLAPGLVTESYFKEFGETELSQALAFAEKQRKDGRKHVIISTELSASVGKPGVNAVVDDAFLTAHARVVKGHQYRLVGATRRGRHLHRTTV